MITKDQRDSLLWLWDTETEDEETWVWRENLTEEEAAMVELWDRAFEEGLSRMARDWQAAREKAAGHG